MSSDDKFFGFLTASKIGVAVPRTVMLPQKAYMKGIDPARSLRNLEYPLDWEGITKYVGFPAILKPADGGGWKNVHRVDSLEELLAHLRLDERARHDAAGVHRLRRVRALHLHRARVHRAPIQYDLKRRCWPEHDGLFMPKALEQKILDGAYALNHALGYDMNSVEFA